MQEKENKIIVYDHQHYCFILYFTIFAVLVLDQTIFEPWSYYLSCLCLRGYRMNTLF